MGVQAIVAKRKRQERWRLLAAIVVGAGLLLSSDGDWNTRFWAAYSFYAVVEFGRRRWLWQRIERNDRMLEEVAPPLGLAPNSVDGHVYEGTRGREYVRVSIEEPLIMRDADGVGGFDRLVFAALFIALAWIGWAWVAIAATAALGWSWYSTRSFVVVSTSRPDGTSDRQMLRRPSDLPAVIGPDTLTPVELDRVPLVHDVQLRAIVAEVGDLDNDSELAYALRLSGKAGRPETLGPLLQALGKRKRPMSPRAIAAVEQAVATIRERHQLPDAGTLALSDADEAGRLGVAREAGTLAIRSKDAGKR